jgi:hypothetical protein
MLRGVLRRWVQLRTSCSLPRGEGCQRESIEIVPQILWAVRNQAIRPAHEDRRGAAITAKAD